MLCSTGWFNDWANLACPNRALSNREVHLDKGKGRGYLETIERLKRKLQKDDQAHRGDLMRVMHATCRGVSGDVGAPKQTGQVFGLL